MPECGCSNASVLPTMKIEPNVGSCACSSGACVDAVFAIVILAGYVIGAKNQATVAILEAPLNLVAAHGKSSTRRDELLSMSIEHLIPIPMIEKLNLVVMTLRGRQIFFSFLLTAAAFAGLSAISSSRATDQAGSPSQNDSAKIAPWVVEHTANGHRAEFIVGFGSGRPRRCSHAARQDRQRPFCS